MTKPYTKKFFEKNRNALRKRVDSDTPIILSAHTQMQYSADTAFPFRQDANFWYVTGIEEPDVLYVHDTEKEYIILSKTNSIQAIFDGVSTKETLQKQSGIERILTYKQGMQLLRQLTQKHDKIATLLPATALQVRYGIAPNPSRKRLVTRLRRLRAGLDIMHLGTAFAHLRMVKSSQEIAAIKQSVDITVDAFKAVKNRIVPGVHEYEVEAIMTEVFRRNDAHHAYPPIIASGINACTLHYGQNNSIIKNGQVVLLDVGAEAIKGAADITRTYCAGKPTKRQRAIHDAVLAVHSYACSILKPGTTMQEYEQSVEQEMGKHLKRLGIIKRASRKQIRKYYPHATSHFLGIDVHDAGDYSRPFEENMVMTVEPGIYIPEENIGVRIEDDVLLTNGGVSVLSDGLSRDL